MSDPQLTILGVYRPQIPPDTWQEQFEVTEDEKFTKEHFDGLVLIEAIADGLNGPFDMGKLGQMNLEFPDDPNHMMVGYDEALLSSDGETLIQRDMNCVHGTGPLRFAVYLHYYDPGLPLQWQGGEVNCPPVTDAPARLMKLMPYTPCS